MKAGKLVSLGDTTLHTAPRPVYMVLNLPHCQYGPIPDSLIQQSGAPAIPEMAAVPSAATRRGWLLVVPQKQLYSLYANMLLCVRLQH